MQSQHQFPELVFDQRKLRWDIELLRAYDDIQILQVIAMLPEHLTQDPLHIITLHRESCRALPDNQAKPWSAKLIILVVQGDELS
jgi:hypothetical protein